MSHKVLATVLHTLKKRNGKTEREKNTIFTQIKAVNFLELAFFLVDAALQFVFSGLYSHYIG